MSSMFFWLTRHVDHSSHVILGLSYIGSHWVLLVPVQWDRAAKILASLISVGFVSEDAHTKQKLPLIPAAGTPHCGAGFARPDFDFRHAGS